MKQHFTKIILTLLLLPLLTGCQQPALSEGKEKDDVSVTLEVKSEQLHPTRAITENDIEDVNIFIYTNTGALKEHIYATGTSHKIDIAPGQYSIYVAANIHRDMGDLSLSRLQTYAITAPTDDGTLTMIGTDTFTIDGTTQVLSLSLKRNAAKIAYNITVDPDAGDIEIASVQLCSIPDREYLITDTTGPTDPASGFHDTEIRKFPDGSKSAYGVFYMLSNRRGDVSSITSQEQKNPDKAPKYASYLCIRGRSGENKVVDFVVYLGSNMTTNFDVFPNEAHTYNITILSDSETDTRITSYTLDITDWWPRTYNVPDNDYGELTIDVTNKGDYTFTGALKVTKGDGGKFAAGDGGWDFGPDIELYIPQSGGQRYDLRYAPSLVKKGVNSQVQYQVVVNDDAGESTTFSFTREFANMVQANFPTGTGSVTVSGELAKVSAATYTAGYCYEDGCTFSAVDGNGYAFDGWYADQAYTQLLSAKTVYKHAPTKAKDAIYARFALVKQPKVEISCNQTNKNSTYMFNKNTVTMTVTDFSGPVTIEASCAAGGIFTSATAFSKTVVSGQSFTLDPIVFVPTAVGNISYTIDVTTSTGIKIGSKTVTNNIAATKLTPTIQIGYGGKTRQALYKPANTISSVYWYGYTTVIAQVTFSPTLDYPAPIESAQLLKIQLYPSHQVSRVVGVDDPGSGYWGVQFSWPEHPDITVPAFEAIEAKYGAEPENTYTLAATAGIAHAPGTGAPLFAPFTEGETFLELPGLESEALDAKMMDREFVKYTFTNPIKPNAVTISPIYHKSDLQIESSFSKITIINNLN